MRISNWILDQYLSGTQISLKAPKETKVSKRPMSLCETTPPGLKPNFGQLCMEIVPVKKTVCYLYKIGGYIWLKFDKTQGFDTDMVVIVLSADMKDVGVFYKLHIPAKFLS